MKKQSEKVSMPVISKAQAPAVFAKLVAHAKTYDMSWSLVRRAFPRKQWGKVREIVQALSKFQTLRAAFDAAHKKTSARKAA
jgi:hypothetical protein